MGLQFSSLKVTLPVDKCNFKIPGSSTFQLFEPYRFSFWSPTMKRFSIQVELDQNLKPLAIRKAIPRPTMSRSSTGWEKRGCLTRQRSEEECISSNEVQNLWATGETESKLVRWNDNARSTSSRIRYLIKRRVHLAAGAADEDANWDVSPEWEPWDRPQGSSTPLSLLGEGSILQWTDGNSISKRIVSSAFVASMFTDSRGDWKLLRILLRDFNNHFCESSYLQLPLFDLWYLEYFFCNYFFYLSNWFKVFFF